MPFLDIDRRGKGGGDSTHSHLPRSGRRSLFRLLPRDTHTHTESSRVLTERRETKRIEAEFDNNRQFLLHFSTTRFLPTGTKV